MLTFVVTVLLIALGMLSGIGKRRVGFAAFLMLGLAYVPSRALFEPDPQQCDLSVGLASLSVALTNYAHMVLFAMLTFIALLNLRGDKRAAKAVAVALLFGAALELEQSLFHDGHCRLRDLLPDVLGALVVALAYRLLSLANRRLRVSKELPRTDDPEKLAALT